MILIAAVIRLFEFQVVASLSNVEDFTCILSTDAQRRYQEANDQPLTSRLCGEDEDDDDDDDDDDEE